MDKQNTTDRTPREVRSNLDYSGGGLMRSPEFSEVFESFEVLSAIAINLEREVFPLKKPCRCGWQRAKLNPPNPDHSISRPAIRCEKCDRFLGWLPSSGKASKLLEVHS